MEKQRSIYMDVLRIIAVIGIIFNHTGAYIYYQTQPVFMIFSIMCKTAVPIFLLISGALLVGKQETIKTLYMKRIIRFVCSLVGISVISYIFNCFFMDIKLSSTSIGDFIKQLWSCSIDASYWYLYTYIGLLCCMPIIRILGQAMTIQTYWYFTTFIIGLYGIWPPINYFVFPETTITPFLSFPVMAINVWLLITGYFIEQKKEVANSYTRRGFIFFLFINIILVILSGIETDSSYTYIAMYAFVLAPHIFALTKKHFESHGLSLKMQNIVTTISQCTFGIYLFQYILLRSTGFLYWKLVALGGGVFLSSLLQMSFIFLLGLICTFSLRKISILKNIL